MLEQFALEQQLDTLAADKGDSDAAIRVAGRRDAMAAVVIVGSGGLAAMVGGTVIAAAAPEMILAARLALAGCKSNPVLCLNQAGIYAADIAAPEAAVGSGSLLAGSTILVGKSQEEAVQFGRQVVAASGNLLKDGKANQGKLGEFIAGKGVAENNALGKCTSLTCKVIVDPLEGGRGGRGSAKPVNTADVTKEPVRFIEGVTVKDIKTGQTFSGTVDLKPTLDRIASGGTYAHRNDGSVFKNLPDKITGKSGLPTQPAGYYNEYVHPTPNISGPGPQRIIVGGNGEAYYTNDHYKTFIKIR